MSQLKLKSIITILKDFVLRNNNPLHIILVGGLAMHHYGFSERVTVDMDAEVVGDVEALTNCLRSNNIPSDLGENFSGWSVVSMPDGYRDRAVPVHEEKNLIIKALSPADFVISKIRRFMDVDIEDAIFVTGKFGIKPEEIKKLAEDAIGRSPKDTALFVFKKNLNIFFEKLS